MAGTLSAAILIVRQIAGMRESARPQGFFNILNNQPIKTPK